MGTFATKPGLKLKSVRDDIDFPITRENLISEETSIGANRDSIIRSDINQTLGIISKRRGMLPYGTVMDWLTDEFTNSNIEFKLVESVVNAKGDLHQQYLFNTDIENPDGESISPMVIARASYIRKPLELLFGTYRFVCSNGAIAGTTFESIEIRGSEISDLMSMSIREDISTNLNNMIIISRKYKELSDRSMDDYFNNFLISETIPIGMKKGILEKFNMDGNINLTLDEAGEPIKLKREHFREGHLGAIFSVNQTKSAWSFYNDLTEMATHRTRSIGSRNYSSTLVSKLFDI